MGNKSSKDGSIQSNEQTGTMKHVITTDDIHEWKPTIKCTDRLKQIVEKEIEYYSTIITGRSNYSSQRAIFNDLLESNGIGYLTLLQDRKIDSAKKKQFIAEKLPLMIEQYQRFMLNLAFQVKQKKIKNTASLNALLKSFDLPLCVQLLWRCHLLHPALYYRDCMKHFGFLLSPHVNGSGFNIISEGNQYNQLLVLRMMRHDNNLPANFMQENDIGNEKYIRWKRSWTISDEKNKFTDLDFSITVIKQIDFMLKANCKVWQINLMSNLDGYVKKYVRYLQTGALMLREPKRFSKSLGFDGLSPTYNIDFIWHTHMMYPWLYRQDCMNITNGMMLDHDDLSIVDDDEEEEAVPDAKEDENDKSEAKKKDNYWTYGRLGQFSNSHFARVVMGDRYESLVYGFIMTSLGKPRDEQVVPREITQMVFDSYFDVETMLSTELSAEPPKVHQSVASCKYGPDCCVGDHINFV